MAKPITLLAYNERDDASSASVMTFVSVYAVKYTKKLIYVLMTDGEGFKADPNGMLNNVGTTNLQSYRTWCGWSMGVNNA